MFSVESVGVAMAKDCLPLAMKKVLNFFPGIVAIIGYLKENAAGDYREQKIVSATARKPMRYESG
jgi:ribulose-5-phosphate 4-epimerase/fuculose-1-phosphate aldolase